jgi:prepilin-type N-terminal cleavage/methylation domain-containing protein
MLKQKTNQKGFTIIEVLIVLAIAGLILLIVFLAVPALNRNSRNTQRTSDISAIGGALTEYVNNNNGVLPTDDAAFEANVKPNYKLGYYDAANNATVVYTRNAGAVAPAGPTAAQLDIVHIQTNSKCNNNASTATGASSRSVIALYRVETGGGSMLQCKEL